MMWKMSLRFGACRAQERLLEEYLDGDLLSGQIRRLDAHLAKCGKCSDALKRARSATELLRAYCAPAADPGDIFTRRVMNVIGREESRREEERLRWHPLEILVRRLVFSAALALGVLLSATMWAHQSLKPATSQVRALDLMPEPAHVTAATNDVLMAAIAEEHGR